MEYNWNCGVCDHTNSKGTDICLNCNSSAFLSSGNIEKRKAMFINGNLIDDRNDKSFKAVAYEVKFTLWATKVSHGENEVARRFGQRFWYFGIIVVIISFLFALVLFTEDAAHRFFIQIFSLVPCFDVRSFCMGKTTYIDHIGTPAIRKNLVIRWFGVFLDLCAWYILLTI
tara:strand:- start:1290 stop:1802 length:513 start_codon:yes stop_codon:yes gene_type:complete